MNTIKIISFTAIIACGCITYSGAHAQSVKSQNQSVIKQNAFIVLNMKCNVCHRSKNPRKVFTTTNMEKYAQKIYKQVFVKKRMPKGNKIKLSSKDLSALKDWLHDQTGKPI